MKPHTEYKTSRGIFPKQWNSHLTPTASHCLTLHCRWGLKSKPPKMTIYFWFESVLCMINFMLPNLLPTLICVCAHQVECVRVLINHLCPQDSWEIVEGLRGGLSNVLEPQKQEGYMLKRRKWPMKGWHKVYNPTPARSLTDPCWVIDFMRYFKTTEGHFLFPVLPYAFQVPSTKKTCWHDSFVY